MTEIFVTLLFNMNSLNKITMNDINEKVKYHYDISINVNTNKFTNNKTFIYINVKYFIILILMYKKRNTNKL